MRETESYEVQLPVSPTPSECETHPESRSGQAVPTHAPRQGSQPWADTTGRGEKAQTYLHLLLLEVSSHNGSVLKAPQSKNEVCPEIPFSAERKPRSNLGGLELPPKGLLRCSRSAVTTRGLLGSTQTPTKTWLQLLVSQLRSVVRGHRTCSSGLYLRDAGEAGATARPPPRHAACRS